MGAGGRYGEMACMHLALLGDEDVERAAAELVLEVLEPIRDACSSGGSKLRTLAAAEAG